MTKEAIIMTKETITMTEDTDKDLRRTLRHPPRVRRSTTDRRYTYQDLTERHQEILRRLVIGQEPHAIAAEMGLSRETVSKIRNSPMSQSEIARLQNLRDAQVVGEVSEHIRESLYDAVEVLKSVMNDSGQPAAARVRAAADLLDRGGYGAVRQLRTTITREDHLTEKDLDEIKSRAIESGLVVVNGGRV